VIFQKERDRGALAPKSKTFDSAVLSLTAGVGSHVAGKMKGIQGNRSSKVKLAGGVK